MENIHIVTANVKQAGVITQISRDTFYQTFSGNNKPEDMHQYLQQEMTEDKLQQELEDTNNTFFLAWVNNELAGYAKVSTATKADAPHPGAMEIERIYVLQQYQSKKVGAALMQHCINTAFQNGCPGIWLGVWEHNHKAIAFYRKWGFEAYGSHIFRLGSDDQTDILMRRAIP